MHIQTKALLLTFGTGLAKTLVHGHQVVHENITLGCQNILINFL